MADKKIKTYKTVKKLVDAYAKGELSARKQKPVIDNGDVMVMEVDGDPSSDVQFMMSIPRFVAQLAKLGGVKFPMLQD